MSRIVLFTLVLTLMISSFVFYFNLVSPAIMYQFTLSNGSKEIVFQEMVHIGKQSYYDDVQAEIMNYKQNAWVLFFEGVRPGSQESAQKFNTALWIEFDENLYKNYSKLYGLVFQNNAELLWQYNDLDFNIDTDMDSLITLYEAKKKISNTPEQTKIPLNLNNSITEVLIWLNQRELKLLIEINRAMMNALVQSDHTQDFLLQNFQNQDLFSVILDERNKIVAQAVIDSEYNKIFLTYWALHFDGVLELLQQQDPNWKIIKTKKLYPITNKLVGEEK